MSPCSAYAVALDAENTITSPIPTSVATTAKSTASGGAVASPRTELRPRFSVREELSTGGLRQRGDRRGETFAAVFGRRKHIEGRARRREQNDVAGRAQVARLPDRILHRRSVQNGNAFARALDVAGSFADRHDRLGA